MDPSQPTTSQNPDEGLPSPQDGVGTSNLEHKLAREADALALYFLKESQAIAGLGCYLLDLGRGQWESTVILDEVFGIGAAYDRSVEGWLALVHPEDRAMMLDHFQNDVLGKRQPFDKEYRIVRKRDGAERWVHGRGRLEFDAQGQPARMIGTILDITERKRIEEALRKSEALYHDLVLTSQDLIWQCDAEGRYTYLNPAWEQVFGYKTEEMLGKRFSDFQTADMAARDQTEFARLLQGNTVKGLETIHIGKSGGEIHLVFNAKRMVDDAGRIVGTHGTAYDITERKRAEQALRESEERYRRITEGLTDYQYRVQVEQGRAVATVHGHGCETVTGYSAEDFATDPYLWFTMIAPEDREAATIRTKGILAGQELPPFEYRIFRKDGVLRWVSETNILNLDASGKLLSYDGVVKDITERKRLEAQLHQSQKMESLGLLAGGVAHDMNNVLGAILGLASVHLEIQPPDSPAHRAFATIEKACTRGGNLIQRLLGFARQGLAEEKDLDLNALVRDEVRLLERTTLARVRLVMELAADLPLIRGDASALSHVLMNLCVNAVDAMADNGTLTLRTRQATPEWIEVQVQDTGCGMPKEVLEKAMDPFFTTKEHGKGTGLGLSIAFNTVVAHRGQMEIHSEPGQGTQVLLRFPASAAKDPGASEPTPPALATANSSLKVLLVDDDELIQSSMQGILELLGHSVTVAPSGEEALARLATGLEPDVVILDMNMPGLGGARTLPRLRALCPAVPVLLATGRVDQTALDLVATDPHVTLLSKPFGMKELQQHLEPLRLG